MKLPFESVNTVAMAVPFGKNSVTFTPTKGLSPLLSLLVSSSTWPITWRRRSSTKSFPVLLLFVARSTVILFRGGPSISDTSVKPSRFVSVTTYLPIGRS